MRPISALVCVAFAAFIGAACSSSTTTAGDSPSDAGPGVDGGTPSQTDGGSGGDASSTPDVTVYGFVDLPRMTSTQSLSGTAYDPTSRTLFAIQDKTPTVVSLIASADFKSITVGTTLTLTGRPDPSWDGEAIVHDGKDFIAVTLETGPIVERFDASGARTAAVTLPAHYAMQPSGNKGLESLTISPSGKYLFTVNENALTIDGGPPTKTRGTTVRILRRELATTTDSEFAYRTEPLGKGTDGDMGISELAAIDDSHLLVMERGYQSDFGNTVRIFRVDLTGATRVDAIASLDDNTMVTPKTLLVDLGTLPPSGAKNPGLQDNPLLDNYEALALGPTLPDGRRLLFVTSDDNASSTQVARVLMLSIAGL